jgi:hypothetical protein
MILQLGNDSFNLIIQTIYILLFFILIFFGQKIQLQLTLIELGNVINRLDRMRRRARDETYKKLETVSNNKENLKEIFERVLSGFVILPESMDPTGIVKKMEHILDVREDRFLNDVRKMIGRTDIEEAMVRTLSNMVEATMALDILYRIALHYYLLAKKTNNYFIAVQLQMQVPLIFSYAKAYLNAVYAFKEGAPVGDSIGPLVVNKFIENKEIIAKYENLAKDTIVYELEYKDRKFYVVKAKGPGGNVGKPGEAIKSLLEKKKRLIKLVIMIDAALKLEGEKSGSVAEGVGAAIGGIGVEKFKIEEVVTKNNVPLYAIIIKMSLAEAISVIRKEIADSYKVVIEKIERVVLEDTKEGDGIIIAGIGNTIGVP